jgi:cbb3-type cytochrome oxidase subunit 3
MSILHLLQWIEHYSIVVVFGVFTLVAVTTYWPGRKASLESKGRILLDDEH